MKKFFTHKKKGEHTRGFSLVEIIVSLGIFSIVAVVALGAFLKIIDANKKAQSLKTAINNLNFMLEDVSRELRVGNTYNCGSTSFSFPNNTMSEAECPNGDDRIAFYSARIDPDCNGQDQAGPLIVAYRYDSRAKVIERAQQEDCGDNSASWSQITSSALALDGFKFYVTNDGNYARVLMVASGKAGNKEKYTTQFNLQTTVSQRLGN